MKVVIDTNVVASASFWRGVPFDCLAAWAQGQFEVFVSPLLLAEYHETLEELRALYPDRKCVEWAEALTDAAQMVFPAEQALGATADPDDEMVLECALAAKADVIISGDKKHLLPLKEFHGIPIMSLKEFLRHLASVE